MFAAAKAVATTASYRAGIVWRPPSRPQIPQPRSTPRRARGYIVSRAFARNVPRPAAPITSFMSLPQVERSRESRINPGSFLESRRRSGRAQRGEESPAATRASGKLPPAGGSSLRCSNIEKPQLRKSRERFEVAIEREESSASQDGHRRDQCVEGGCGDAAPPEQVYQTCCFDVIALISHDPRKSIETVLKAIELAWIAHAGQNLLKHDAWD